MDVLRQEVRPTPTNSFVYEILRSVPFKSINPGTLEGGPGVVLKRPTILKDFVLTFIPHVSRPPKEARGANLRLLSISK